MNVVLGSGFQLTTAALINSAQRPTTALSDMDSQIADSKLNDTIVDVWYHWW